jgi:hypothetical protein
VKLCQSIGTCISELPELLKSHKKPELLVVAKSIGTAGQELGLLAIEIGPKSEEETEIHPIWTDLELAKNHVIGILSAAKGLFAETQENSGLKLAAVATALAAVLSSLLRKLMREGGSEKSDSAGKVQDAIPDIERTWEDVPDGEWNYIVEVDEAGVEHVKAATLHKLVQRLTMATTSGKSELNFC